MKRMAMVIGLKEDKIDEYKELHANVWEEILDSLTHANITNYSIHLKTPENLLFSYWEYVGNDFAADMQKMSDLAVTKRWWDICMPCQEPVEHRKEGEWWAPLEEVFYHE